MEAITARIYAHAHYKKGEKTNIIFELTNHAGIPFEILKWYTPLEGLKSDCLIVKHGGKKIPYDSRLVKRGRPGPGDFLTLEPGSSVQSKVDMSEAYSLTGTGKVTVEFRRENLVCFKQSFATVMLTSGTSHRDNSMPLPVKTRHAEFISDGGLLTLGEQSRMQDESFFLNANQNQVLTSLSKTSGLLPYVVTRGTAIRRSIVTAAHKNGYNLTVKALSSMKENAFYKTWFGAYAEIRFKKIKSNFKKIKVAFEQKVFRYDLSCTNCDNTDYAYTYSRSRTIWICYEFWNAPDIGPDSRAGTIVHEQSHASAFTDDIAYGEDDCKTLALNKPAKAVNNGYSHEFFAKG